MKALKKARKLIETAPDTTEARILSALVIALESDTSFPINDLYKLNYNDFELALELLQEWRLDRYYMSKVRLLDLSVQVEDMSLRDAEATAGTESKAD